MKKKKLTLNRLTLGNLSTRDLVKVAGGGAAMEGGGSGGGGGGAYTDACGSVSLGSAGHTQTCAG